MDIRRAGLGAGLCVAVGVLLALPAAALLVAQRGRDD